MTAGRLQLCIPDVAGTWSSVRLWLDVVLEAAFAGQVSLDDLALARADGVWRLDLPLPRAGRLEYLLDVVGAGGVHALLPDPANPCSVQTAFGPHSVVELPGYQPPRWLNAPVVTGAWLRFDAPGPVGAVVPVSIWQPEGHGWHEPLPLLVAHDGPELDRLAGLTGYAGAVIASGTLPAHRVALLEPVRRDAWYSADPAYGRALLAEMLPALRRQVAVTGPVVAMGVSLGALSALTAAVDAPGAVGGLFCQSGSFFQRRHDWMERDFPYFDRITATVSRLLAAGRAGSPMRIGITCGALEENVHNNRDMADALARQGHDVTYAESADAHCYTAWRDAFDPHLTAVLGDCWV